MLVNDFLQCLTIRDADGVAALFTEEIDWYVPGNPPLPWTGERSFRSEVASYFHKMWPLFAPGKSVVKPESIVIKDEDAVVFANFTQELLTQAEFSTPRLPYT